MSVRKKKSILVKTSLNSPYTQEWGSLTRRKRRYILDVLTEKFTQTGLQKTEEAKKKRKWRKRKAQPGQGEGSSGQAKQGWTDPALRQQLAIGINEVTRCLERNELGLVLVCKSAKPPHMTSHLIPLSLTRQVPACRVPRLSENMATVLGLKCVLALGFKRDSKAFANQVRAIVRKVPRCHVPWMPRPGGSATALATDSESQESASEGEPSQSHKRKLDEVPQEASELRTPKAPLLQPLRVRRVVPNPKKVRKPKLKEKSKGK